MKKPVIVVICLIISIAMGILVACGKNGNAPSPEGIAKVVGQANDNGLPKGTTVVSLQYPSYISRETVNFYHLKLTNSEVRFLENIAETKDLGGNLYIHDSVYKMVIDLIRRMNDSAGMDEGEAIRANLTLAIASAQMIGIMDIMFDGFSVDALPEKIYPVNDRSAESRLLKDINTSKIFARLILETAAEYVNLAHLAGSEKTRRIQRLNNGLNGGNKSLFKKVFSSDVKNLTVKGFLGQTLQ